jgi:hypothetical protein
MKHSSLIAGVIAASASVIFMVGCAKVPETELSAAKSALDSAKAAQADKYVAQDFNAAQDLLNGAVADIEKQKAASALSRNYDKDKADLANVVTMANAAKAKAADEITKAKNDAAAAITSLTAAIADAKALLTKKAPKGKAGKAMTEAKGAEIKAIEATATDAQGLNTSGDYIGARDKANAGLAKIEALKAELNPPTPEKAAPAAKPAKVASKTRKKK